MRSNIQIRVVRIIVTGNQRFSGGRSSVGRALDCDSGGRGFKPHRSPHFFNCSVTHGSSGRYTRDGESVVDCIWAVSSAGRAGDS